ncbi:SNF1-related protein kinase regulatory subunit beta-1 [Forsythia ovata]|uniref:SNF1-related protein kinase regulatory subunit beta-1 n=1 Tax=Forsythia ovata TaxID=205694 RepID=A0ABD1U5C5_9LAMI
MGNTTGREGGGAASENSNHAPTSRIGSADLMASSPPPNRRPSDLPCEADQTGCVCNILDVHDYVSENLDSVAEFEAPQSPEASYSQAFPGEENFAKDPVAVPPQLHLPVLDSENSHEIAASSTPKHMVLNHLFIQNKRKDGRLSPWLLLV